MNINYLLIIAAIIGIIWFYYSRKKIESGRNSGNNNKPRILVEETKTGRKAIIIQGGAESDPRTIDGELQMFPRWIKVAYILKNGELSKKITGWRSSDKFNVIGQLNIEE